MVVSSHGGITASEQWFLVCRDTHNNTDHISFSYEDRNKFSKLLAMNKKN